MEVSAHIDWISATRKNTHLDGIGSGGLKRLIAAFLPEKLGTMDWHSARARNGYTVAMQSETGILIMSNPDHARMGLHIVMSGKTLARTEQWGMKAVDILRWYGRTGFNPTRVDYAVDVRDSDLSIKSLSEQIERKTHKSLARSAPYLHDKLKNGKTQYVGSMKNRTKLLRIYDKALELKLENEDWKRIEIELHGNHAQSSAKMATASENFAKTIQGIIRGYCDFPEDEIWQKIFQSDEIWLAVPEVKQGNTEQWLLSQCAPALARILDENEGFMHRFMEAVQEHRD